MNDLSRFHSGDESKYNSSLDILQRVNRLIEFAETSSFMQGLDGLSQWRNALSALEREIRPYCDKDEIIMLEKLRVKAVPHAGLAAKYRMIIDESRLRGQLEAWENEIRRLMGKKGMGLKTGADPRRAL